MSTKKRNFLKTLALKALFAPLFFLFFAPQALAAEFGPLTVFSQQGHPLRAQIELLSVTPEEEKVLMVGLAPVEAYRKSGLDYALARQLLSLSLVKEGSRIFIRVHSAEPVNDAFLNFLLELSVNDKRMGREFFISLEPSPGAVQRAGPLSSAAIAQRNANQHTTGRTQGVRLTEAQRANAFLDERQSPATQERRVVKGDTLYRIALGLDRSNVTLDQLLVSLYRSNPDAFINNNMNLLREGAVLDLSDVSAAGRESTQAEARRIVRLHTASFRQYRQRLAGMVSDGDPGRTASPGPVAQGRVAARVSERPTRANQSPDRLELSKIRLDTPGTGFTVEEKIALQGKIEDTNRRIVELEKNVTELKGLLTVISEGGHALAESAKAAKEEQDAMKNDAAPEKVKQDEEKAAENPAPAKEEAPAREEVEKAKPEPPKARPPTIKPRAEVPPPQAAEPPGFIHFLLTNTVLRIVWGITLAAGAVFAFLYVRRRRAGRDEQAEKPVQEKAAPLAEKSPELDLSDISSEKSPENQEIDEPVELDLPNEKDINERSELLETLDTQAGQEEMQWDVQPVEGQGQEPEQNQWAATDMDESGQAGTQWDELNASETVQESVPGQDQSATFENATFESATFENAAFENAASENAVFENAASENAALENTAFENGAFENVALLQEELAAGSGLQPDQEEDEQIVVVDEVEFDVDPEEAEIRASWNALMAETFGDEDPLAEDRPEAAEELFDGYERTTSTAEPDDDEDMKETVANNVASLELDLSDINLETLPDFGDELPEMKYEEKDDEDEYNPYRAEMEDKLELAMAYIEMVDKEGARELLEEIIERGTPAQIEKAKAALDLV